MQKRIATGILGLMLWFTLAAAAEKAPEDVVRQGVNQVLAVVQDPTLDKAAKRARMRELIAGHFDFDTMARSILARNWKKASAAERARFVELFQALLENTYMTAIESYTSETIRFGRARIKGHRAVVPVTIVLKTGSEAPLRFKLRHRHRAWRVYDVVIEGVSLVNNFRGSFRTIVRKEGIAGLLQRLQQKVGQS